MVLQRSQHVWVVSVILVVTKRTALTQGFTRCEVRVLLLYETPRFLEDFLQVPGEGVGSPQHFEMAASSSSLLPHLLPRNLWLKQ